MTLKLWGPGVPLPTHTSRSDQLASLSAGHSIRGHLKPQPRGYSGLKWEEGGCRWPFNPPLTEQMNDGMRYGSVCV